MSFDSMVWRYLLALIVTVVGTGASWFGAAELVLSLELNTMMTWLGILMIWSVVTTFSMLGSIEVFTSDG